MGGEAAVGIVVVCNGAHPPYEHGWTLTEVFHDAPRTAPDGSSCPRISARMYGSGRSRPMEVPVRKPEQWAGQGAKRPGGQLPTSSGFLRCTAESGAGSRETGEHAGGGGAVRALASEAGYNCCAGALCRARDAVLVEQRWPPCTARGTV
jgi:hypothetical protein